jgi:hypothetical protein
MAIVKQAQSKTKLNTENHEEVQDVQDSKTLVNDSVVEIIREIVVTALDSTDGLSKQERLDRLKKIQDLVNLLKK